jgi:hypothetical protein
MGIYAGQTAICDPQTAVYEGQMRVRAAQSG